MEKASSIQKNCMVILDAIREMPECTYVVVDNKGIFRDANIGVLQLLGIEQEEVINKLNINDILLDADFEELSKKTLELKSLNAKIDLVLKEERIRTFLVMKPVECEGCSGYLIIFQGLIKDSKLEKFDKKALESLKAISSILNTNLELEETLDLVLEKLSDNIDFNLASIMFLDGYKLNIKAFKADDNIKPLPQTIKITENDELSSILKLKQTTIISENIQENLLLRQLELDWVEELVLIPLMLQESFFGMLILFNSESKKYDINDINIIEIFASTCAYSIKNAELTSVFRMQLRILRENVIERTKALELIKVQNQKILEADRMKNEFIAHMSHELRTPLHAIIGFSEALKMKIFGALSTKQEEYIDDIHSSGIHLLGMINDMLDLSKIESKKMDLAPKDFSIELATNEVINVVLALANKKNISIEECFEHAEDVINADHRKYQQVLYNLLSNAIKFTPDNGLIKVTTKDSQYKGKPALGLTVEDNGIGISQENIDKIFNKFHQVENVSNKTQSGSGLGLTITKELIEMHNGTIMVESNENAGSKFMILLPLKYIKKNIAN